jgi:hypothetical protein
MKKFFEDAASQKHPMRVLKAFLDTDQANYDAKRYDDLRFVGYVLDISYDTVTIITSDPFKTRVGGVPRNSLLIMLPSVKLDMTPPHFTLLRVLEAAPHPLTKETQQTYFELQKKSMPELDIFTQSELQWGALKTGVLGMFYPHPIELNKIEFSGDMNNFVSAHKYIVYSPDDNLLNLVINALVPEQNRFQIGDLRLTECRLPLPNKPLPKVPVIVSTNDFKGTRTAMFGKTRLGKSNVVKLIVQSLIETTKESRDVGQLIFDINGEYANDNPQDNSFSIASAYPHHCVIYALAKKENTQSKPLKLDFYEHPDSSHQIIGTLLRDAGRKSIYVERFLSVDVPGFEYLAGLEEGDRKRATRKILMYWAILKKAGFVADEQKLKAKLAFDPRFNREAMKLIFGEYEAGSPKIDSLDSLVDCFEKVTEADRTSKLPSSTKGKILFDPDDDALLNFFRPVSVVGAGPGILQSYRIYHDKGATNFVTEILKELDSGMTVILDLGNANEVVMLYFARELSKAVFVHQTDKFTNNRLKDHYVQLYFEEAHNLLGYNDESEETRIYRRFAKEGAKYHIGMVYSTQSPTTINPDLLAQTENFFIAHLSSQDDVNKLAKLNVAYESLKDDILQAKTPGYIRMLTRSHRFVVSMQARLFVPAAPQANAPQGG